MTAAGKAAPQRQHQKQHRKRQGDQAHQTPPLIHLGSGEGHHASMFLPWQNQGIFMMPV
jgi:hypothetical protein